MNRIIAGLIVSAAFATSAQAVTITTFYRADGSIPSFVPPGSVFQSFNAAAPGNDVVFNNAANSAIQTIAGYTQTANGRARTYQTSVPGQAVGPTPAQGGSGAFLALRGNGNGNNAATYTIGFNTAATVFSFVFSTLDSFNSVTLNFTGGTSRTLTGGQILTGLATGSTATSQQGGRITYDFGTSGTLSSVTFRSTGNAFEIDEIAAAVPEPGTWAMMILGFGIAGWHLRARRQPKVSLSAA